MEVRAIARDRGVSAYKVRLVLDMIRGKSVDEALRLLQFTQTPTAKVVAKVVSSAAANAENGFQMSRPDLLIVKTFADEAQSLKRFLPRARGRAGAIIKRRSHITVIVGQKENS